MVVGVPLCECGHGVGAGRVTWCSCGHLVGVNGGHLVLMVVTWC